MQKYNAKVIYQSHDDDGILEVVEEDGVRSLHFGTDSRQSSMSLRDPDNLELSYVRAMMTWQLYLNDFENALMVGLGGGSLAKYLLQQFPEAHITAIEQRKSVVKIARRFFQLPFNTRLKIINGDGGAFIRKAAETMQKQYDLLFIDAFDHDAMSSSINGAAFFDACRSLLKKQGIMAINLWNTDRVLFEHMVTSLSLSFDDQILQLPVRNRGNVIVFCFPDPCPSMVLPTLRQKAQRLESMSGFEYSVFIKDLKKHNGGKINRSVLRRVNW